MAKHRKLVHCIHGPIPKRILESKVARIQKSSLLCGSPKGTHIDGLFHHPREKSKEALEEWM